MPHTPKSSSRIGLLFVASPLFPAEAARALMLTSTNCMKASAGGSTVVAASTLAVDGASCAAALEDINLDALDGLVVQLSTFATAELLHDLLARLGDRQLPLALWALEEKDEIVTNSLCGAQLWSSTLARLGQRSSLLLGNPEDAHIRSAIASFAAASRGAAALVGARVALIGAHAEWFTNLAVDVWALQRRLGVTVTQISLPKFIAACEASADACVAAEQRWRNVSFDDGRPDEGRKTVATTYARLKAGLESLDADAIAIRDWPEILYDARFRGTWSALGELAEMAVPQAPEGDVMGALTALVARGFDPNAVPFLTDISGVDRTTNHLVLWHYGVSPRLADGPRSIDAALKQESFPLKSGPLTLFRLSLTTDGRPRIFVTEGDIARRHAAANRAAGLFQPARMPAADLITDFINEGYEHHVTGLYGHWANAVTVLARQLGAEVHHV